MLCNLCKENEVKTLTDSIRFPIRLHSRLCTGHFWAACIARIHPRTNHQARRIDGHQGHIDEKLQEEFLIAFTHTVIDPRTMMIHPANAAFTNATMMGARRSIRFATCAHRPFVRIAVAVLLLLATIVAVQIGEVQTTLRQWHRTGIGEHRLQMGHGQQEDDRIEGDNVHGTPDAGNATIEGDLVAGLECE